MGWQYLGWQDDFMLHAAGGIDGMDMQSGRLVRLDQRTRRRTEGRRMHVGIGFQFHQQREALPQEFAGKSAADVGNPGWFTALE